MATNKPTKPSVSVPARFGGIKTAFTDDQIKNGYEDGVPQIIDGGNLNNTLDGVFQKLTYIEPIADVVNSIPTGKSLIVDSNNRYDYFTPETTDNKTTTISSSSTDTQYPSAKSVYNFLSDTLQYKHISNCITSIPQDIKLELNNGTLTLKAGSKVYVPNGVGVFNAVTIQSDIAFSLNNSNGTYVLSLQENYRAFFYTVLTDVSSGSSYTGGTYGLFYDTVNNTCKRTNNGGSTWYTSSFPIAIVKLTAGIGVTSIEQTFNGFGYIGSTVFALPGVEGLIPNGRNSDGTLNNTKFKTTKVLTITNLVTLNKLKMLINANNLSEGYTDYNNVTNFVESSSGNIPYVEFGEIYRNNGIITSFSTKTTFKAVDEFEFQEELNSLSGTIDTINASLAIKANASDVQSSLATKANVNADNFTSTGRQTIVSWGMPDYAGSISISSEYTTPSNGFCVVRAGGNNRTSWLDIDSVRVFESSWGASYGAPDNAGFSVGKNQKITFTGVSVTFYPIGE